MNDSYDGALLLSQETVLISISSHMYNSKPLVPSLSTPTITCINIEKVDLTNASIQFPQDDDTVHRALKLFAGASGIAVVAILVVTAGRHWILRN